MLGDAIGNLHAFLGAGSMIELVLIVLDDTIFLACGFGKFLELIELKAHAQITDRIKEVLGKEPVGVKRVLSRDIALGVVKETVGELKEQVFSRITQFACLLKGFDGFVIVVRREINGGHGRFGPAVFVEFVFDDALKHCRIHGTGDLRRINAVGEHFLKKRFLHGLVVDFQGNFAKRGVVRVECAFIGRLNGGLHNGGKLFGRELEFVLRERSRNIE